jgi:hypothetical protein
MLARKAAVAAATSSRLPGGKVMSTYGTSGYPTGATGRQQHTEHREGNVARQIEQQTAKMPSDWFLWGGLGALATSMILQASHRRGAGNFMGFVAPTLLIMGLYNKLVKVQGSDAQDQQRRQQETFH